MLKHTNNIKISLASKIFILVSCLIAFASPLKAKTTPKFSDYSIKEIYQGQSKLPDFKNDEYIEFKLGSELADMKKGPNFAGHYTIMQGGCGTECIFTIVVDNKTGQYFKLPIDSSNSGIEYKVNSKMLLVSVTKPFGSNVRDRCILKFYVWERNSLIKLRQIDLRPNSDKKGRNPINCSI